MSAYYLRRDPLERAGPFELSSIRQWLGAGQLPAGAQCSADGQAWMSVMDVPELGGSGALAAAAPEIALFIRQGTNVQGPFAFARLRGYAAQRRLQPYMLLSYDGLWWCTAQDVPGLLPDGYVPVPPPGRPTAVPTVAAPAPAPRPATAPVPAQGSLASPTPRGPVRDSGSITLTGMHLSEEELAPPRVSAPVPSRAAGGAAPAADWYLRQDARHLYGPFTEAELRQWIAEGRVGPEIELSRDGTSWVPGSRMPAFFPRGGNRVPGSLAAPRAEPPPAEDRLRRLRRRR